MKLRRKKAGRIWQAGLASVLLLLLCGCTKKEELVLVTETAEAAEGAADDDQTVEDHSAAEVSQTDTAAEPVSVIYVHVCGAVERPGVYELEEGSRVYEAVEQAGGFTKEADRNYVNQAQALEDGVMLVIPTREETAAAIERETVPAAGGAQDGAGGRLGIVGGSSQGEEAGTPDGRININTASEAQLCEIPGVGATRAAAIAAYRESHGAFEKPEDIMKVNGIKEGMYEKIKDSISVN